MPPREETPLDQEVLDRTLAAELAKGTDRRVAEGRAKSAAVRAYKKQHGEPERAAKAPEEREHAAAAAGDGEAAQPAAAAARPAAAAPAAAVAAPAGAVYAAPAPAAPRTAPPPTGRAPTPKPGAPDKHRLLALVPPEGIQRVEREQGDRINVFPHLLIEEFISLLVVSVFITVFSTFVNAPLRELANPNLTPNPSKAPWYFLGLQELLRYLHPMIAGIIIPTLILVGLGAIPYVDRNPSTKPGDRKLVITLFTMLFMFGATLTIVGSFFRGTGYNWAWPWSQGLFFDL
jgi:menaquinol-cytochrome c reductase cytochrome b/c subunit